MPDLLIDLGNSCLKWAWCTGASMGEHGRSCETWRLPEGSLRPAGIGIASVAGPEREMHLQRIVRERWPERPPDWVRTGARWGALRNGYREPSRLGVDRWLAMIAVRSWLGDQAYWILDCGTAITLDHVAADGTHHGGVILPGPRLMAAGLGQGAAALQGIGEPVGAESGLGQSTEAGVWGGIRSLSSVGVAALVEGYRRGRPGVLFLTGGDAETVRSKLPPDTRYVPDLVLQGLAVWRRSG